MAAASHRVSELVTELQSEYERSRAFLSALEQSLEASRATDERREATADGTEAGVAESQALATDETCDALLQHATAPPKKSGSLKGKLARLFSRKDSKSSSKVVVVDPTADSDANVSSVQGLRRPSVVALGDHLDDSCLVSGGGANLAKRSQSFVTRSGNSLAAMPPPQLSSAAMLRATSFRAAPPTSASQFQLDGIAPPYPAAATVAASASQLSLPAVDFRRSSFSMSRGGGAGAGAGGLPGLLHSSSGCRRRSVELMVGQSGAAASVPVISATGAGAGGVASTGSCGGGTSGTSLFKKLQQMHVPVSECGLPELSPCSPRATLAGATMFGPGGGSPAGTPPRAPSIQHSASFQRRSVTSSAQHTFVDGAAAAAGALQAAASVDGGVSGVHSLPLAQAGAGSPSGASARRSSLHMPPSAAPSQSALRSQSFRHGGGGGSRASTGTGCGACGTMAAAVVNEHADLTPESDDDDDDDDDEEAGGVAAAVPARRVASMGPVAGGGVASTLMASLLRRADVVMAATAAPTGGSGAASPPVHSSGHGMLVGAVDAADVVGSGASEAGALWGQHGAAAAAAAAGGAGSRHASGTAAFVPVAAALCGSPSSRRLTASQLQLVPPLASPVGHRAAGLLQSHHHGSFGHALSPTPPPAGPLSPQPPHAMLGAAAAAAADGSQQPPGAAAAAAPASSYLSQHRRMSFRAASSSNAAFVAGSPAAGHSGGAAFVI